MKTLLIITLFTLTPKIFAIKTFDIFSNENQTRRQAQGKEFEIALGLGGCAGVLIGANIGMSAAHCQKKGAIKSGIAVRDNLPSDATIVKTIEVGSASNYDYWIFEIDWKYGVPLNMRLVPAIQTTENELKIGNNNTADKIFTLGFPQDISAGRLIYSYGYGKKYSGSSLINNISLINGNSGGGILRESDEMLVSVVSGGPHSYGQPGWKGSDWNDPSHWNNGPALWKVYAQSNTLKSIFPNGRNKFLSRNIHWQELVFALPILQQLRLE